MSPELPPPSKPGYSALRAHRWSAPGADYFVTFNLKRPASGLCERNTLIALGTQRIMLESDGHWIVRTWVVMADHVHVLFTLGADSELAKVMRLFKGRLTITLRNQRLHGSPATTNITCGPMRIGCRSSSIFC